MSPPSSVTELQRFMGMVNQMTKFSPNIAHISKPLRDLLSTKNSWTWEATHTESFNKLKREISSPRVGFPTQNKKVVPFVVSGHFHTD